LSELDPGLPGWLQLRRQPLGANTLASPRESIHVSILGMGYASWMVIKLSFL